MSRVQKFSLPLVTGILTSILAVPHAIAAEPTIQASDIVMRTVSQKALVFRWTPGNGDGSIVVMSTNPLPLTAPTDGNDYPNWSNDFSASLEQTVAGDLVVSVGSGNQAWIYGLTAGTTYYIAVYAYGGSGELIDYLASSPATATQVTNGPAMHNYDNFANCVDCHNNHGGGSGFLPRQANQEDVCITCHNAVGPASTKIDFAIHGTPAHVADDVDCGSCHEVHSINAGGYNTTESTNPITLATDHNIDFIRANVDKYVGTATPDDAVHHDPLGHDQAFEGAGATTARGICQACHSQTDYHQHDESLAASQCHKGGTSDTCDGSQVICTDCHDHSGGFAASGGSCTGCHASAQGTPPDDRRAVVAEFSRPSSHIDFGALTDADCIVCHQQSATTPAHSHQDGLLTLWDVDNHANAGAQLASYADPTASATEAAKLNNFCLKCHDSDGAQAAAAPSAPFTGSIAPADIATAWPASSHATAGSPVSCFGDGVFGCHGSGHGGEKLDLLAPADTAATPTDYPEEEEGFCYTCHDGAPAGTDIQAEFAKGTNGTDIFHHPVVDSEQGVGREVECSDCHNPHAATSSNAVAGVSGIDFDGSAVDSATAEYQVCLKCHGDTYNDSRARTTNKRTDFAPDRSSYHPIAQRGRNRSQAMVNNLISPWIIGSVMTCSDCHNNNSTSGPQGPHGSSEPSILKKAYWKDLPDPESFNAADFALCFECHSTVPFTSESSNTSNFAQSEGKMLHRIHVVSWDSVMICAYCHYNVHGNENDNVTVWEVDGTMYSSPPTNWKTRMINFMPGEVTTNLEPNSGRYTEPTWSISTSTRKRTCYLTCHGKKHASGKSYTPSSLQDNDILALPAGG